MEDPKAAPPTHRKTPAPEPARVSSRDSFGVEARLLALSARDTKPAYCLTKVRAEGRFVVRFVAMVHSLLRRHALSVGAKPNHGFFGCQQSGEKNFRPRRPLAAACTPAGSAAPSPMERATCFAQERTQKKKRAFQVVFSRTHRRHALDAMRARASPARAVRVRKRINRG